MRGATQFARTEGSGDTIARRQTSFCPHPVTKARKPRSPSKSKNRVDPTNSSDPSTDRLSAVASRVPPESVFDTPRHVRPPLIRRTLQHNVYDFLREGLMSGEFAPGERLTVRGVAEKIGTSVMPVREALKRLTSEGALEPMSTGATRVPVLYEEKLRELLEIRLLVEGLATRRAASRISDVEYRGIHSANADVLRAARAGDVAAEARANERFHFCIYRAARSEELLRIIEHLWLKMGPYLLWLLREGRWPSHSRGRAAFRYHEQILIAIRRRDGVRAEAALRADLSSAAKVLLDQVRHVPKPPEH